MYFPVGIIELSISFTLSEGIQYSSKKFGISLLHFFSMRLYGSRTYKKNLKDAEESIQKAKEEI